MRLTKVLEQTRTIEVEFSGETVEVEYFMNVITPGLLKELQEYGKEAPLHQLEAMVKKWDVVDDEGEEIRPTQENLPKFPLGFLIVVLQQIDQDMEGWGKEEKKGSGGGSLTTS